MYENILKKLEGLHTVDTAQEELGLAKQSILNLLSKLKKEGYVTVSGGGKQKRLYKVSQLKQRPRRSGMFDIINENSKMKVVPWFDHQVHGKYTVEDAIIDAVKTKSFRVILASLSSFRKVKNLRKLFNLAKEKDCVQEVGALYDLARMYFKIAKLKSFFTVRNFKKKYLIKKYSTKYEKFKSIEKKWHVSIPFNRPDLNKVFL
tara:strand:- start:1262 stop:1873 length:612 start_codon:yes stop_codon:yes gene_type:complete